MIPSVASLATEIAVLLRHRATVITRIAGVT